MERARRAPNAPRHSQAGLHPPGGHGAGAQRGSGDTDGPGTAHGALHVSMQLQAPEKPPPLGSGGLCPVARQQLPAAPLYQGARVPLPEPGAAAAGAELLLRGSPGPRGALAGAAVVCAKPGAWHPASPEESLERWRVGTPGQTPSHPVPDAGDMARGVGGTLCAPSTQQEQKPCSQRGALRCCCEGRRQS